MQKKITISIVLLLFSTFIYGKNVGTISGQLFDGQTHQRIELANVVLLSGKDSILSGTLSDAKGIFRFEKIPFGSYFIKVSSIGYNSYQSEPFLLNQHDDKKEFSEILLTQISYQLTETNVTATKKAVSFELDKKIVDVSELTNATGSSVSDALQNAPSVKVDGDGTVYLRGSTHFKLLIDGKPSVLSPSEVLQQIPTENIQKIEIITSPSARYDSEGAAGIINLISKKQKLEGFSGQSSVRVGTRDKYDLNALFNSKKNNNSFTGGIKYSNQFKDAHTTTNRNSSFTDSTWIESLQALREIKRKNLELSAGWDHELNPNNTFSLGLKGGIWSFNRNIETDKNRLSTPLNRETVSSINEHFSIENKYLNLDALFEHKFSTPESKITFAGNFYQLNNVTNSATKEWLNLTNLESQNNSINRTYTQQNYQANIDYSGPLFEKYKVEFGIQSKGLWVAPEQNFINRLNGNLTPDALLSGIIDFTDFSNSVYSQISGSLKTVEFSVRMRLENESRKLTDNLNQKYNYNELYWFPSVQVSKKIDEHQQLSLAYSKRIEKPAENRLNPLPTEVSSYAINSGNPNLLPEITQAFEMGYHLNFKKGLVNLEAFTRKATDAMENSLFFRDGNYYDSYENIAKRQTYGAEFMTNLKLTSWFHMNVSTNAFYEILNGKFQDGYELNNESFAWESAGRTTFIIHKNTSFDCLVYYYGPRIFSRGKAEQFYYIDFILKQYFMNRQMAVSLRTHNTFDTGLYRYYSEGSNYYYNQDYVFEGPIIFIGISYKFNNYNSKRKSKNVDMNYD